MKIDGAEIEHPTKGRADVYHSVRDDFFQLLRDALADRPVAAAFGPIYEIDPAENLLGPFRRSAIETGWDNLQVDDLAPEHVQRQASRLRLQSLVPFDPIDVDHWTRAGLVLEIARRHGVRFRGHGTVHFNWKMRGTITGRFGCETHRTASWSVNPMTMDEDTRRRCVASDAIREVIVMDFKAMDVCSMIAIVPGLAEVFNGHKDPHQRVAKITGLTRDQAKLSFLTWAYGGAVDHGLTVQFRKTFPSIFDFARALEHGEFPRMVQTVSAQAFRAGLSEALPLLANPIGAIWPMLTVHDELVLDASEWGIDHWVPQVQKAMEAGASQTIGAPYRIGIKGGYTYEEAKNG